MALTLVAVSVVAVLLGGAWLAVRVTTAARAVQTAQDEVGLARAAYEQRDLAGGAAHVAGARDRLVAARRATSDPVWAVAGTAPVVGDDVRALRAVVASAAGVLEAAEPLAARAGRQGPGEETTELLAGLATDRGTLDAVRLTHARITQAQALGVELRAAELHPALAAQVDGYADAVDQVEPLLADAVAYSGLVPVLLGLDEPTDLLVVVQTPAEVRSLGGLAGLVLEVRAQDGSLEVRDTYAGSTVDRTDAPVLDDAVLAEHYVVLGDRAGRYVVNAPMVPDGALASSLLAESHVRRGGGRPDLVVLTDLSVLSRLLAVTGPVTLPDGTVLDAAGSDAFLQHQVYVDEPDPARQDAVFAAAALGVVDALLAPTTDPVGLGRALLAEADAHRLVLWSPDPATQDLVRASGAAGDLLADPADVGVFLNDATSSKMQWFLRSQASVVRRDDGTSVVRVDLTSTAPAGGAGLPAYVTGSADELGLPPGGQRVQVMVHGPVGDGPSRWLVDGEEVLAGSGVVAGRGVGVRSVDVAPGQVVRVEVELALSADLTADRLVATPSVAVLP